MTCLPISAKSAYQYIVSLFFLKRNGNLSITSTSTAHFHKTLLLKRQISQGLEIPTQYKSLSLQDVTEKIEVHKAKLNELYKLKEHIENQQSSHSALENEAAESWTSTEFSWSEDMQLLLAQVFKKKELNLTQLKAVNATMTGKDVLVVMPTGGGKSLCYQLPALLCRGITIVISPLVSLMSDQIMSVKRLGINAEMLHSGTSFLVSANPTLKLLYITPERLSGNIKFLSQVHKCYQQGNLSRIVLDEVHCVHDWGTTFRPDYKNLSTLKQRFPDVPLLGLTATATSYTLDELKKTLSIPKAVELITFYPRKNLHYEVRSKPTSSKEVLHDIVKFIQERFIGQSGIVYCFSRANCGSVCQGLNEFGIEAAVYHSHLSHDEKNKAHTEWLSGQKQVICATTAFGMGVDKPDVRFVVHHSMSKNMETYYQESGRAGRDGLPAFCLLYFGFSDLFRNMGMVLSQPRGVKRFGSVMKYGHAAAGCRHKAMARLFDVDLKSCSGMHCDLCSGDYEYRYCDVSKTCQGLMEMVQSHRSNSRNVTGPQLVEAACKMKLHDRSPQLLQSIIIHLLIQGYFRIVPHLYSNRTVCYIAPGPNSRYLSCNKITIPVRRPTFNLGYTAKPRV